MAQRGTKRPYDLALLSDTGEYHHQLQTTGTNSTSVPEHPPTGTLDDGHPKQHRPCTDNTNTFLTSTFKVKCFRISNIPSDWTKQKLLNVLHNLDPSSGSSEIFENWLDLFHSGCGNQIALLNVKSRVPFFDGIISNETKFIPEHNIEIDCHFYGMTPLHTPRDASADIIAVTGLAGHPYGSWKNKESGFMWLKDFLPADFKDVRILTYGYNTNLTKDTSESFLLDYLYGLIQALENIRRSTETTRPIIFIGHSMGGLLIGQTLLHANMQPRYRHIFEATRAIIFFATPHRGMEVDDIQLMIKNMPNHAVSREMLVEQLKKDSDFLYRYHDELRKLWAIRPEISVTSFYETLKTPSVQRISDSWTRNGEAVEMVNPIDASLFLPHELRVPVNADHSNIVKFRTRQDEAYKTVVGHITDYLEQSNTGIAMSSAIYDQSKFCGRRDILDELQKVLGSDDTQVSVLHGLGGVGKTSIARQFGSGLPKKGWAVLWIPSSSKTKIDTEFENTARKLSSKDNITNPVSYVTTWLLKNYAKRWLMIFDELDDTRIEISQYIPSSQPLGKYLITTRDSRVANHIGLSLKIEIKPLDKESSLVLLRSIVFDPQENILLSEEQAQRKVVQELGHLPLAITIVGAYLKDRYDGSCIRYLEAPKSFQYHVMKSEPVFSDYPSSVWDAFEQSVSRLQRTSISLLQFIAACGGTTGFAAFRRLLRPTSDTQTHTEADDVHDQFNFFRDKDKDMFEDAFKQLVLLNLLSSADKGATNQSTDPVLYGVHSLVIVWIRNRFPTEFARSIQAMLYLLKPFINEHLSSDHPPTLPADYNAVVDKCMGIFELSATDLRACMSGIRVSPTISLPFIFLAVREVNDACNRFLPSAQSHRHYQSLQSQLQDDIMDCLDEFQDIDWDQEFSKILAELPEDVKNSVDFDCRGDTYGVMDFLDTLDKSECLAVTFDRIVRQEWHLGSFHNSVTSISELRESITSAVKHALSADISSGTLQHLVAMNFQPEATNYLMTELSNQCLESVKRQLSLIFQNVMRTAYGDDMDDTTVDYSFNPDGAVTAYFVALRSALTAALEDWSEIESIQSCWEAKGNEIRDLMQRVVNERLGPRCANIFRRNTGPEPDWGEAWSMVWSLMSIMRIFVPLREWIAGALLKSVRESFSDAVRQAVRVAIEEEVERITLTCPATHTQTIDIWSEIQWHFHPDLPTWKSAGWYLSAFSEHAEQAVELDRLVQDAYTELRQMALAPTSTFQDAKTACNKLFECRTALHEEIMARLNEPYTSDNTHMAPYFATMWLRDCDKHLGGALSLLEHIAPADEDRNRIADICSRLKRMGSTETQWRPGDSSST